MSIPQSQTKVQGTWQRLGQGMAAAARFFLAQDCLLCARAIRRDEADRPICSDCHADLPRLDAAHCPVCALPGAGICGACLKRTPAFDGTCAAFTYDFPLDRLIQTFKYQHRLALSQWMGEALYAALPMLPAPPDLILPMPLHPRRLAERGFNQAVELARPVAQRSGIELDVHSLGRALDTPPQASLPWKARRKNIRGAFLCLRDLSGLHVVVVDDVMTTGATLDEVARCLKTRGAAQVTNLVVARTLPRL